ncbi:hypothetical protein RI367_007643 [Sorochytrium milnesiophthora]
MVTPPSTQPGLSPDVFRRDTIEAYMKKFRWSKESDTPAYIVIHNKVYDIRDLINEHPGGAVILTHVGRDGTDAFEAFHPESTGEVLADYYVGDMSAEDMRCDDTEFAREIRKLRTDFEAAGLYKSNKLFFAVHFTINMVLWAVALAIMFAFPNSLPMLAVSAMVMGLFWQQCGWLSHDFLHHAVFRNRAYNDLMGAFLGGVCQGFSVNWWKNKHNTHHAQPNVHGEDPDIDTMPLLAWSEHALEAFADLPPEAVAKLFVHNQALLYFPILAIARVSWAVQSALYVTPAWKKPTNTPIPLVEQLSVAVHWMWYFGAMAYALSPLHAVLYFVASQTACGLLLATVFSLNHNGMHVLSQDEADRTDFYTKQVLSSRNVNPSLFMNWFCGGLNFQIEHHLFPMMPRHSYPQLSPIIRDLCARHNLKHHSTGFWAGTGEVLSRLGEIGQIARKMQAADKKH